MHSYWHRKAEGEGVLHKPAPLLSSQDSLWEAGLSLAKLAMIYRANWLGVAGQVLRGKRVKSGLSKLAKWYRAKLETAGQAKLAKH